jgi:sporulation protein YlmC with PRC-barrel domain
MKVLASAIALTFLSTAAMAQTAMNRDTSMGPGASKDFTVSNYYKQDVYDRSDNKIGTIDDVLIDRDGRITSLIVGVGGFLGVGEKDIATKFQNVQLTKKNDKWYLTMDATKDALKAAPGYKYDRTATTWVADNNKNNTSKN